MYIIPSKFEVNLEKEMSINNTKLTDARLFGKSFIFDIMDDKYQYVMISFKNNGKIKVHEILTLRTYIHSTDFKNKNKLISLTGRFHSFDQRFYATKIDFGKYIISEEGFKQGEEAK
jgi:hypothetical protein